MREIKLLTDEQLTAFEKSGEIEILGHKLGRDDLRLAYTVDSDKRGDNSCYEAHSDGEVRAHENYDLE